METKRIEYIDTLRGFAIFLVTLGHILENCGYRGMELQNFIYSFHMPLFICISGFVIAYSFNKKLANTNEITLKLVLIFVYGKFKAIMLPYYMWALVATPLFFYTFNGTLDYNKVIDSVFINNTSYWFLPCLFGLSFIFIIYKYLLYKFHETRRNNAIIKVAITTLLVACLFLLYYITRYDLLRSISNYIVPFIIGVAMAEYKIIYNAVCNNTYIYAVSLIAFCLVVGIFIAPQTSLIEKISRLICGILSIPVCFNLFSNTSIFPQRTNNWLNHIGQNTLIIYILQFSFIKNLPDISGMNIFLQICILSALSILIIHLILFISKLFEQNKQLRTLFLGKK